MDSTVMPNLDDCVSQAQIRSQEAAQKAASRQKHPHAVYRMYSGDGTLLYIGCTYNLPVRLRGHISWLPQVASITLEWHANLDEGLAAETQAIKAEKPLYNVKDTPKAKPARYWRQHLAPADTGKAAVERFNRPVESA
jgi:predicted GIY-YIG superfamily endonuclease